MITQETINKYPTTDLFLDAMFSDKNGKRINYDNVGTNEDFLNRFENFKETIKEELPHFSKSEIIKFHNHYQEFKKIYDWNNFSELLRLLEYEELSK